MRRALVLLACLCVAAAREPPRAGGPARRTQVFGFSWENCRPSQDPAVLKSLAISPDPIVIPGTLTAAAAGSTKVELASQLQVNLILEKEVAGFWVKVPCLEDVGSCVYPDVCQLLDMVIPPGQNCPEPLHTYGLPCHCPFKAGDYTLPKSDFYVPDMDLPSWLTNGNYRVKSTVSCQQKQVACLKLRFSLRTE